MRPLLALALLLLAAPPALASTSDAVNAINGFDPENRATLERIEQVIDGGDVDVSALDRQLDSPKLKRRWAAAYIAHNLAADEADFRALHGRLNDREPAVRSFAAYSLIAHGKTPAILVLIDLLTVSKPLRFSEPASPVDLLAEQRLVKFTGADFGFDHYASREKREKAIARWREWWKDVRDNIRWDPNAKRFRWRRAGSSGRVAAEPRPPLATPASSRAEAQNNTGTITLQLEFQGRGADSPSEQARLRQIAQAAEDILNADGRTGRCIEVNFQIEVRFGSGTDDWHQVKVNRESGFAFRASFADLIDDGSSGNMRFHGDDAFGPHGARTLVHELGHLMGIEDEYSKGNGPSRSYDNNSMMGDHRRGDFRQRHVDDIVGRLFDEQDLPCERWRLDFGTWTANLEYHQIETGPNSRRHFIGLFATASVLGDFWVNKRTNAILPAGSLPCGMVSVQQNCGEVDGNSEALKAIANKGNAHCALASLKHLVKRWETVVSGQLSGGRFLLRSKIGDRQRTRHVCTPPAQPPSGERSLIKDSMAAAGALDFAIEVPAAGSGATRTFDYNPDPNRHAYGTAKLSRLP